MNIDWAALASVFGVSLVVTVALVGLFTLGIVGLSKQASTARNGASGGSFTPAPRRRVPLLRAVRGGGHVRDLSDRRLTGTPHLHRAGHTLCVRPGVRLRTLRLRRSTAS
ncbi:hypothetical protein ACVWXU_007194 [Streptomyces sp. TE33382]